MMKTLKRRNVWFCVLLYLFCSDLFAMDERAKVSFYLLAKGDLENLKRLPKELLPNIKDDNGNTLLHKAFQMNSEDIALYFFNLGVFNLYTANDEGRTLYDELSSYQNRRAFSCIEKRDFECLIQIRDAGVPLGGLCDEYESTLLHIAVREWSGAEIQHLLNLDSFDVGRKNKFHMSPINIAFKKNNFGLVQMLKEYKNSLVEKNKIKKRTSPPGTRRTTAASSLRDEV